MGRNLSVQPRRRTSARQWLTGAAGGPIRILRGSIRMAIRWKEYSGANAYDELITSHGRARKAAQQAVRYIGSLTDEELHERRDAAELAMRVMGITFTVYSDQGGIDRAWPFDIIPRIIPAHEWRITEAGLKQRATALNMFIADIYGEQRIIRDGIFPGELLAQSVNF